MATKHFSETRIWQPQSKRAFSTVEKGLEFSYGKSTQEKLAAWAKWRKTQGLPIPFIEFYNQLSAADQMNVVISEPVYI